jgi:hypothetical protein
LKTKEHNKGTVLGDGMVSVVLSSEGQIVVENAEIGDNDGNDVGASGKLYSFIDDDDEECDMII